MCNINKKPPRLILMLLLAATFLTFLFFSNMRSLDTYLESLLEVEQHLDKFELLP